MIYDAIDDIKAALSGMLKPEEREHELGEAEVRQTFRVPRLGVDRRLVRPQRHDPAQRAGPAGPRRRRRLRGQDRVAPAVQGRRRRGRDGYECGIGLENFQDIKEGDVIEAFEVEEIARSI